MRDSAPWMGSLDERILERLAETATPTRERLRSIFAGVSVRAR